MPVVHAKAATQIPHYSQDFCVPAAQLALSYRTEYIHDVGPALPGWVQIPRQFNGFRGLGLQEGLSVGAEGPFAFSGVFDQAA